VRVIFSPLPHPHSLTSHTATLLARRPDFVTLLRAPADPCRTGIKKSEAAKKQRELKKFGKQIQVEKLKSREADKKGLDERLKGIKRSEFGRGSGRRGVYVYRLIGLVWGLLKRVWTLRARGYGSSSTRG
jgi:hypothetical protein